MITAIIETRDDEVALAQALAALVPAATEGIVRDVIVVDHGSQDGTLMVADAAGCTIVDGSREDDPLHAAAVQARGDWLIFVPPSLVLPPEWQSDALAFIDRALVGGRAQRRAATFRGGRLPAGIFAWLRAVLGGAGKARLVAKTAWLAERRMPAMRASAASSVSGARRGAA